MKTIDVKSMLIGFLLCLCGVLFMGQTNAHQSKYQFAVSMDKGALRHHLFDTETGDTYIFSRVIIGEKVFEINTNNGNLFRDMEEIDLKWTD
jgi:hypothetical protein